MTISIYKTVTASILAELEAGALPWIKPWRADAGADRNLVSGKPYRGVNRMLLAVATKPGNTWATFNQWKDKGAMVKRGEHGTHIVYFQKVAAKSELGEDGEEIAARGGYALLKSYVVFNESQVDGYEAPAVEPAKPFEMMVKCEQTINKTGATIQHGGGRAFYAPSPDIIRLPHRTAFDAPASYYATAFHELMHWTGSVKRLDRNLSKGHFGNPEYAFEELVAEIGAAYLCADHCVQGELRHAGYIQSWMRALKDHDRAIFKACALAQTGADYIMEREAGQLAFAA